MTAWGLIEGRYHYGWTKYGMRKGGIGGRRWNEEKINIQRRLIYGEGESVGKTKGVDETKGVGGGKVNE